MARRNPKKQGNYSPSADVNYGYTGNKQPYGTGEELKTGVLENKYQLPRNVASSLSHCYTGRALLKFSFSFPPGCSLIRRPSNWNTIDKGTSLPIHHKLQASRKNRPGFDEEFMH
ncbi:hypothetical protein Ancab_006421 [Ancistrocladus abbreviatus]